MTSVNVTTTVNTIDVTTETGISVVQVPVTSTVTAVTAGPQGPIGPAGPAGIVVEDAAKVDKSIVYYDGSSSQFRADAVWTTTTLTNGGNF